jgi:hypothetical protein
MAVVSFQRSEDAALAKTKYDGKFIDGRKFFSSSPSTSSQTQKTQVDLSKSK